MIFATISWITLYFIFVIWIWFFMVMSFMALWLTMYPVRYFLRSIKGIIDMV